MKLKDIFNATPKAEAQPMTDKMRSLKLYKRTETFMTRDLRSLKLAYGSAKMVTGEQRASLLDIYEENLILDAHLRGICEKRTLSVIQQDLRYHSASGDIIEHEIFEHPAFDDMLKDVFEAKFWGFTVLQFENEGGFGYYMQPRKYVLPDKQQITTDEYANEGYLIESFDNAVFIGKPNDLGLFMPAGVYSIFKRNLLSDWAEYSERAGMMLELIEGTGNDKLVQKTLNDIGSDIGSGKRVNVPEGVNMDFKNLSSGSQNALFENFFDALNKEQSKLILGQTMTTEDGSSLSQSEVHSEQQQILLNSDKKFMLAFLNTQFKENMSLWSVPDGGYFAYNDSEQLSTAEQLDNDLKLMQLGYTFKPEYLKEKYGIDD